LNNTNSEGSTLNLNSLSQPVILKAEIEQKYPIITPESKEKFNDKTEKVKSETLNLNTPDTFNSGSPKVTLSTRRVIFGFFTKRNLNLKTYYRRILIGVKKGITTPTLPPKTLKLMAHPLIRVLRMMWPFCLYICVTNRLVDFNNIFKCIIVAILTLNILFSFYITIVRAKNIRKLLKAGAFDVRNSPLDRMSSLIAKMLACSKGLCESGGTVAGAVAGLYTIDNLMRDLGYEPIFLPFLKRTLTNSSEAVVDPSVEADKNNTQLSHNLRQVHNRHLSAKEEESLFQVFYDSQFISKDEWMELQREFKTRFTAIGGEKESILKQMKENLEKGYGNAEGTNDQGLTDNSPTSSKILEALKERGHLTEDLFPKPPLKAPTSSKILEALKESGHLTEDTFSANTEEKPPKDRIIEGLKDKNNSSIFDDTKKKDSNDEFKRITGSDSDSVSQANKTDNKI
jgi:hypothetical protein